jgi:predicted O-linked N-acetylglucosamine transferase (SPINDLY family)
MAGGIDPWSPGWAALQAGRPADAEQLCRPALAAAPSSAEGWFLLGMACLAQGRSAEAEASFRQTLTLRPDIPDVHYQLGNALWRQQRFDEAEACFRRAIELRPTYPEALINLGNALQDRKQLAEAEGCFRRALVLRPDYLAAVVNLGTVLLDQSRPGEAEAFFRRALQLRPELAGVHYNLGRSLRDQGEVNEAEACLRHALALAPDYAEAHSDLLLTLHYRAGVTPAELAAAHAEYQRRIAAPLRAAWRPHSNDPNPDRPLRVGLVSPDFGRHPVGYLIVRAVEALARRPGAVVCYSGRRNPPDDLTARFRAVASTWHDTPRWTDEQLAETVRADGIDVLIDLAGHTGVNRLLAFARKPAPVQVTWLGYEGTTGLEAIDYLIADEATVPPGAEADYRERVLRLPGGYVCYDPPADAPDPGPPPALAGRQVTFACFNNPAKLSPPALAAFAAVLSRVPGARLLLQYRGLTDPAMAGRVRKRLAAAGADPGRAELRGGMPVADYLAAYREVDVALDPFPFSGGLTTCDALWMGVPVVTLPGPTFASRHGLSYLSSIGLAEELAARDVDDYAARAAMLAQDLRRLAELRAGLRDRMVRSPLCQGDRLADELLAALRVAWRAWASGDRR